MGADGLIVDSFTVASSHHSRMEQRFLTIFIVSLYAGISLCGTVGSHSIRVLASKAVATKLTTKCSDMPVISSSISSSPSMWRDTSLTNSRKSLAHDWLIFLKCIHNEPLACQSFPQVAPTSRCNCLHSRCRRR